MAMRGKFRMSISGPDNTNIFRRLAGLDLFGTQPIDINVNYEHIQVTDNWIDQCMAQDEDDIMARFDESDNFISIEKEVCVKLAISDHFIDPHATLNLLASMDFQLCSCAPIYEEWGIGTFGEKYFPFGFAGMHFPHGWACAFKGAGHNHLVSRRWLDYGPWRVLRGPNDTTLVQFHDVSVGVDAGTALKQARHAHQRMGIDGSGGFIKSRHVHEHDLEGHYDADAQLLKIVVQGRDVSQSEMLDACDARNYDVFGPEKPLDNVAFVFMDELLARKHLHELWLRELECRTIINDQEVLLNNDYDPPPPEKPQWVRDVETCKGAS